MADTNEALKRWAERIEAKPDPEPVVLPPTPVLTETVTADIRLVVTEMRNGLEVAGYKWNCYGSDGKEMHPRQALGAVLHWSAMLVAKTDGWHQGFWRAANGVLRAMAEIQRSKPTAPPMS